MEKGEVKGRLLTESHVASVVKIIRQNQGLFEATVIDLGAHSEQGIMRHQEGLAHAMTANLTPSHHSSVHSEMRELQRQLRNMKLPAYVQSVLMFDLIERVLEHSTLYHCQRNPKELGDIAWVLDAKNSGSIQTPWERWWQNLLLPTLQSKSLRKPSAHFDGGDYSHFGRYLDKAGLAEWLVLESGIEVKPDDPLPINLRKIFENIRVSSAGEMGLELVDILTNGVRRALRGNLQPAGWLPIRSLMVHRKQQYLHIVSLNGDDRYVMEYTPVLKAFFEGGKGMMTLSALRLG